MLPHPGIFAINHLLGAEAWARDKLKPYAGQCVEFRAEQVVESENPGVR